MRNIVNGYEDIINKSRPVNNRHKRMSNYERAAQFSPFAALTGLEQLYQKQQGLQMRK